jgi:D-alanyl-D-alanine carboxypeptidase
MLAGMIAEAAAGEPVHIAWRRRFLDPLHLGSLHLEPQEMPTGELAHGFSRYLTPTLQDISAVPRTAIYSSFWTAGAIMGSPLDMALWTRALYRGEVLSSDTMKQMTHLVNATPFFSEFPRYGLGTMEISSSKGAFLGHAGDGFGYRCLVGHSPRLDATVLFVINTDTGWDVSGFVRMVDGWKALVAKL